MKSEIVVDVSEAMSAAVNEWASYLSISREEFVANAVEFYLQRRDAEKVIAEARESYTAIESDPETYSWENGESNRGLMNVAMSIHMPRLDDLPKTLPLDNAIRLELEEGVPIFRAPSTVQIRIEQLLEKQQDAGLSAAENRELDLYEEIDDYLSFVNRTIRDRLIVQST